MTTKKPASHPTHTPGPLIIQPVGIREEDGPEGYEIITEGGKTVSGYDCSVNETALQDAVLHAAAPDLLAALKMVVESEKYPEFNILAPWYVAGKAAIEKATGEGR